MPNPQIPSIQEYLKRLLAAKTTPDMLLPAALNLEWGMSKEACSALTDKPVIKEEHDFAPSLLLEKDGFLLKLYFGGDYDTLDTIYSGCYESYSNPTFNRFSEEQKSNYRRANYQLFLQLKDFYTKTLGSPVSTLGKIVNEKQLILYGVSCKIIWEYKDSTIVVDYWDSLHTQNVFLRLMLKPKKTICHFDFIDQASILPTDLTAAKLGIDWNFSKEEALAQINGEVLPQVEYNNSIAFALVEIRGQTYKVQLLFDYTNSQLLRISIELYRSRSFWDGDWTYEEMNEIGDQIMPHYYKYLDRCRLSVGDPFYFGEDGYMPNTENSHRLHWPWTRPIALWSNEEADIQVEFEKEDKELPYILTIKSYPPVPDTPE